MEASPDFLERLVVEFENGEIYWLVHDNDINYETLASTYFEAGVRLLESLDRSSNSDRFLQPFFFLILHAFELRMKTTLEKVWTQAGSKNVEQSLKDLGHNLDKILMAIKAEAKNLKVESPYLDENGWISIFIEPGRSSTALRYSEHRIEFQPQMFIDKNLKEGTEAAWWRLTKICRSIEESMKS